MSTHNSSPIAPSEPSLGERLDSWKEIAAYLKRDIRTVQLWEKREGLPIHRHNHTVRASVYAFVSEIEAWQKNRTSETELHTERPEELPATPAPIAAQTSLVPEFGPAGRNYLFWGAVLATALTVTGLTVWRLERRGLRMSPEARTLAVLPFEDLSTNPTEGYVADGLTDDLITNLGRGNQVQVISRTSVMRFKGKRESLAGIAETLKADLVLEGTVVYGGKHARITAQLVDAKKDQQIWANSYDREFESADQMIALQDEVAGDVSSAILEKLAGGARQEFEARRVDASVRTAYLRGRYFWNKRDEQGLKQAINYFNQAIARDPGYAPAYAGLADCYNLLSVWGSLPDRETFPKAKAAALRALQLDPSSGEAYTSLAFATYRDDWDFAGAERYFQKAIQLNPNYATAHQWYGEFLGDLRRAEQSIAESRKAQELDPLSTIVGSDLADSYIHAGRYQDAINELQRILTMDPNFVPAHLYLSGAYHLTGREELAEAERQKYIQLSGDKGAFDVERIRQTFAAGKAAEARKAAESLLKNAEKGPSNYFYMAQVYVSIGDRDRAFECLEKVYQQHSWWLVGILVDPGLAPLRDDPRFLDLVRRVGVPVK